MVPAAQHVQNVNNSGEIKLSLCADLWRIPWISADAALAAVGPPLPGESAAVQLVVVVVGRSVEAVSENAYAES